MTNHFLKRDLPMLVDHTLSHTHTRQSFTQTIRGVEGAINYQHRQHQRHSSYRIKAGNRVTNSVIVPFNHVQYRIAQGDQGELAR